MEDVYRKRIYSFLVDCVISNSFGIFIFSLLNLEKDFVVNSFKIFLFNFNYGLTLQFIIMVMYFIIFDILNNGKTFGKLLFSINVVNKSSLENLSVKKLLERTFYKSLSILVLPISVILFVINNGYTIQDKIVDTKTIN